MGSTDVLLNPALSCRSSPIFGTKCLLILVCVCLARPLIPTIVLKIWKFIIWSSTLFVCKLRCLSKKSIAFFYHFSFHSDFEYCNMVQNELGTWPQRSIITIPSKLLRYPSECMPNWNFLLAKSH